LRRRLYSSCVQSSMLHRSENWPVRKEYEVVFQLAEMRMVRWMCGIKLQDRVPSKGLGSWHNLGTTAKQVVLVWACGAKKDNDWVKKCMEYEVEDGARDKWVAVASAGPYANLHLAPDRIAMPASHHSVFSQAGYSSYHQTNSIKALKENANLELVDVLLFRWHAECRWRCRCSCGDQNLNWME